MDNYILERNKRLAIAENIQREQEHLKTCKDYILWYLNKHQHSSSSISIKSTLNIVKILNGFKGDFVVFNNGGSMLFDIWLNEDNDISDFVNSENYKHLIYCYRIKGEDVIKKHMYIPNYHYEKE